MAGKGARGAGQADAVAGRHRRRLGSAVVYVTLALAALAVATAGPDAQDSLVLAKPRIGDAGTYELKVDDGDDGGATGSGGWTRHVDFRWGPGGIEADRDGRRVGTDQLVLWYPDAQRIAKVERGTSRIIQQEESIRWHDWEPNALVPTLSRDGFGNLTVTTFPTQGTDCAFANAAQGTKLGAHITFPRGCFGIGREAVFHAAGAAAVDGWATRHYVHDGEPRVALWFADALPVPVQVLTVSEGRTSTLRLVGFEAGTQPRGAGSAAKPMPLPEAPVRPWGINDAGVGLPYPLSTAYLQAAGGYPPLQAYLQTHAGAYGAAAAFTETRDAAGVHETWFVILTDGKEPFCLEAERTSGMGTPVVHRFGQECIRTLDGHSTLTAGPAGLLGAPFGRPPPHLAPSSMPAVSGLMERWAWYLPGRAANGYAYSVACADAPCSRVETHVGVLASTFEDPVPGGIPGLGSHWGMAALWFKDGRAESVQVHERGESLRSRPDPAAPAEPAPPRPSGWSPEAIMEPQVGTGLLVVLAGLLYWIWPKLLGLAPVRLFSRLGEDAVLMHAARRRILAAVEREPGIHHNGLQRVTGLASGVLAHHVRLLAASGHVVRVRAGSATCYFSRPVPAARMRQAAALRSRAARALWACAQAGPVTVATAARRTGLPASTVRYHLHRIADAGGLVRSGTGRTLMFRLAPG